MKIALVSPLYESVPPQCYGGTERVISYLTEELVAQGHEVSLFASGDSRTKARLYSPCSTSLREGLVQKKIKDPISYHTIMLDMVTEIQNQFDIIHFHTDYYHFPIQRTLRTPSLTTIHGRLDLPDLQYLYRQFQHVPLVSISWSQRRPLPQANWVANVYHGLPQNLLKLQEKKEDYVVFLGRIHPEKDPMAAIDISKRLGIKLKMAAKVDPHPEDQRYFQETVRPLLESLNKDPRRRGQVEYLGEISQEDKQEVLGKARALIFPIDWPEPFGLVMIEAMSCGTPVLAFNRGSVPEIISPGETGIVVENVEEATRLFPLLEKIGPAQCRAYFERNFSVQRMATDYLDIYRQTIIAKQAKPQRKGSFPEVDF